MLDTLTVHSFNPYLRTTFRLQWESREVPLELIEVKRHKNPSIRTPDQEREPFSIIFRGPLTPPISQKMYSLEHEHIGRIGGLFLVPIHQDETYRYYQAVFA